VQAGVGRVVFPRYLADGQYAANMLDCGRNRHRQHKQRRLPIDFRLVEFGFGKPFGRRDICRIHHTQHPGQQITRCYTD